MFIVLAACKDEVRPYGAPTTGELEHAVKITRAAVPEIEKAIAAGNVKAADEACIVMATVDELAANDHGDLAKQVRKLCDVELAVLKARIALERAEAARKAKPQARSLAECSDLDFELAMRSLKDSGNAAAGAGFAKRWAVACPAGSDDPEPPPPED
jgi:hypothetical protein